MADSAEDSAPEGIKTFASRTSKGKDENQGALAKNVITPLVTFAKNSATFIANCKRPEDQRELSICVCMVTTLALDILYMFLSQVTRKVLSVYYFFKKNPHSPFFYLLFPIILQSFFK